MVKYTWNNTCVPSNLRVRQVHGVAFSSDKRVLLRVEDNRYKLTGGKPEGDEGYEETLKREYIEEINVELEDIHYLGYFLVEEDNGDVYAQVRMTGKIKKINENRPDLDGGKQYRRFLSIINNVKKYLNYQDSAGNLMIDDAITMVKQKYEFEEVSNNEEFI